MYSYYLVYKPFGMLSQFTPEGGHPTLADLSFTFPKDVYPVGRLDADSEGLLLLTNDNALKHRLLTPQFEHKKTYWVQVEGAITREALHQLEQGVRIRIKGKEYQTAPANAKEMQEVPNLPERTPPIRYRAAIPTSWIQLTLKEGKNRQVRRMTAAVGFPTLRLVRGAYLGHLASNWQSGEIRRLSPDEIQTYLKNNTL